MFLDYIRPYAENTNIWLHLGVLNTGMEAHLQACCPHFASFYVDIL